MSRPSDEFTELLLSLNQLMVNEESLDATLARVAYLACNSPIGADSAGVTLQRETGPTTAGFHGDAALQLDYAQYATNDGPCLTASRTGETVRLQSIASESNRWPDYAAQAAEHGVESSLSLPLTVNDRIVGALNLYASQPAPFTDHSVELAQTFAQQAAVAIANAEVYWRTYELTQHLEAALESRDCIGQAKGVLIATRHITSDEAFDILRRTSQEMNIKLRDVAEHLIRTVQLPDSTNI